MELMDLKPKSVFVEELDDGEWRAAAINDCCDDCILCAHFNAFNPEPSMRCTVNRNPLEVIGECELRKEKDVENLLEEDEDEDLFEDINLEPRPELTLAEAQKAFEIAAFNAEMALEFPDDYEIEDLRRIRHELDMAILDQEEAVRRDFHTRNPEDQEAMIKDMAEQSYDEAYWRRFFWG